MNRVSRTDEPFEGDGYNQSPNPLSNDLTTNQDLNGIANARELRREDPRSMRGAQPPGAGEDGSNAQAAGDKNVFPPPSASIHCDAGQPSGKGGFQVNPSSPLPPPSSPIAPHDDGLGDGFNHGSITSSHRRLHRSPGQRLKSALFKFSSFIGPGFMIAVAYIDPGNYATDIAAGASYRFRLLFIVLLANVFAIFLQSLAIKLGTVSGLNLAEACRAFLPRWLNYILYFFAEVAIIATDIAEVIGFAIALNLLIPQVPLVAGCAISIVDVMVILLFYRPEKSMKGLRIFEYFIVCLVLGVVVCFCIQLSLIKDTPIGKVFKGYLPSGAIVKQQGLYQACGILGATVMPHSLYLGSGIVQPRLRDYDTRRGLLPPEPLTGASSINDGIDKAYYIPSLAAIRHSLKVSILELAIALFTFALFVNSAILIVSGVSLYNNPEALEADIFSIHALLSVSISPAAGTTFALALLLSGVSAGIVCTIAGQMVSEGALNWKLRPWVRRLVTRSISITPSIIIAGAVGRPGLNAALNGSQVALSIVLPFVTAPLIYFTCRDKHMTVQPGMGRFHVEVDRAGVAFFGPPVAAGQGKSDGAVKMGNSWYTAIFAVLVWLVITVMNVANLVLLGKGE
ncbi:manganese transporter [Fusarium oxysporum f. sp. radicis-lycopersici 26381]|uniref:Manganese transporter n=1 Tax=Fusarium oxysporum NRRL 32931 TaxID=660029 RepID=W9HBM4_FUSOX|nr:manganese transporter [Fusarium oxysporum NRRL 32931]EWZ78485.1 manganese transporter [Fusarium oxysporum f. sp. lycopersici MN25]EXL39533.1 manganese transporter [Fusarium oxysporum f. sp. radicis-lycopersici 26381]